MILLRLDEFEKAKKDSIFLSSLQKESFDDLSTSAEFNLFCSNYEIAFNDISKALEHGLYKDYCLYIRTIANFYLQNYDDAFKDFLATDYYVKNKDLYKDRFLWLSLVYYKKGSEKEALEALKKSGYNSDLIKSEAHILEDHTFIKKEYISMLLLLADKMEK